MRVRNYYQNVIRDIISERNLSPLESAPSPIVGADAAFNDVLLHTDWYVNAGDRRRHYRYRRYLEVLKQFTVRDDLSRIIHFDIGCGAGVFSWAFIDWAKLRDLDLGRVELYGLDHSTAMVELALEVKIRLADKIPNYPTLNYGHESDILVEELLQQQEAANVCCITLGHVLAQANAHTPDDIRKFAEIIARIRIEMDATRKCVLVGIDAKGASTGFAQGWDALLDGLEVAGVLNQPLSIRETSINDETCAKRALLKPAK